MSILDWHLKGRPLRILLAICSITFFSVGFEQASDYQPNYRELRRQLQQQGALTQGLVTHKATHGIEPDFARLYCKTTAQFTTSTPAGVTRDWTISANSQACEFDIGDRVKIRYLPTNPQQALIEGLAYQSSWFDRITGLIAMVGSCWGFLFAFLGDQKHFQGD